MIDFTLPEKVQSQLQMTKVVAEQIMRPKARFLDEHEHERPNDYVNVIWPIVADQQKASLERERKKADSQRDEGASKVVKTNALE